MSNSVNQLGTQNIIDFLSQVSDQNGMDLAQGLQSVDPTSSPQEYAQIQAQMIEFSNYMNFESSVIKQMGDVSKQIATNVGS